MTTELFIYHKTSIHTQRERFKYTNMKILLLLAGLVLYSNGDIYLHNPRGSNNRLDEEGRNRNNPNRMFDSQNNDRGGYNVGSLYYYEGSKLPIEWTNQHSCGGPNNHCEIILQYMCADNVRDGATTATIPENPLECDGYDCNSDTTYGMNEDFFYYARCKTRERNQGLFTADQNLKGDRAKYTRQNPAGTRRAYECPEERDYYPYWHPSPWKDIAILTNDATRCPYYQAESENVKGRGECILSDQVLLHNVNNGNLKVPNTKAECEDYVVPEGNQGAGEKGKWKVTEGHGLSAPECRETQYSRDNHLGNGPGGKPNMFNWTVAEINHERCVMRIRYNISTEDYPAWGDVTAANNKQGKGKKKAANLDMYSQFGLADSEAAADRGYEFKNNPQVEIFPGVDSFKLQLAINTAQYGRTFQDRSHTFAVRQRPADLSTAVIHNINVRGKRGNIVQVYPAVEYDQVPNDMEIRNGEYAHFQWTGSNSNPQNNDGQGRAGTDRSNVVLQDAKIYNEGSSLDWYAGAARYGHWGRSYPEQIKDTTFLGFSESDMMNLALLTNVQFRGEMSELDDAGTYFDLGPKKVTSTGVYHYMCTRNNNFSNRSQKGRIQCRDIAVHHAAIGWNGGEVVIPDGRAKISVDQGDFSGLTMLRIEKWDPEEAESKLNAMSAELPPGSNYKSDYLVIHPDEELTVEGQTFTIQLMIEEGKALEVFNVYYSGVDYKEWTEMEEVEYSDGWASMETSRGGAYVVRSKPNSGAIAGIVIAVLAVVALLVVGAVVYFRKNPEAASRITRPFKGQI